MPPRRRLDEQEPKLRHAIILLCQKDAPGSRAIDLSDPTRFARVRPHRQLARDRFDQVPEPMIPAELLRIHGAMPLDEPGDVVRGVGPNRRHAPSIPAAMTHPYPRHVPVLHAPVPIREGPVAERTARYVDVRPHWAKTFHRAYRQRGLKEVFFPCHQTEIGSTFMHAQLPIRSVLGTRPMRIVHYLPRIDLTLGGIVRYVLDLARVQARLGEAPVIVTHPGGDTSHADPAHVECLDHPLGPGRRIRAADRSRLRALIAEADVVHIHGVWIPAFAQIARIARQADTPYVLTTHGMLDDWCMSQRSLKKRAYLALAGRRLLDGAATVICSSDDELAQARRWFDARRAVIVPPVMDLDPYRHAPGPELAERAFGATGLGALAPGTGTVLFLSRLHEKKGVEVLIDAAHILRDRNVSCRVLIAGTGEASYVRSLESRIGNARLGDVVHLVGHVDGTLKLSLYARCDLLALPTSQENFGLVLTESLACATPIVTTRGVDIWRELEQGGGGVAIDRTPEGFANAISDLLADAPRREQMGRAGRDWVFEHFDEHACASAFADIYASATG